MRRFFLTLIIEAVCFAGCAAVAEQLPGPYNDIPRKDTPRKLQEAWLRFHEGGLCRDVEAAFIFDNGGMQIWSRIESEKDYMKFQGLFAPLGALHRVELYTNRSRQEREPENGNNPPPSLWQNLELRANLGDRAAQLSIYDEDRIAINPDVADPLLKQRLLIYAEQTLGRNRKMDRSALDLFALTRLASDPEIPADIRSKALEIAWTHAKDMEKNIAKLASDLEQAIPRPSRGGIRPVRPSVADISERQLVEEAARIYESTQSVARRVHRFIYPEYYTVELGELRNPGLLQSLRTLRQTVLGFQKALIKSGRKQWSKPAG